MHSMIYRLMERSWRGVLSLARPGLLGRATRCTLMVT